MLSKFLFQSPCLCLYLNVFCLCFPRSVGFRVTLKPLIHCECVLIRVKDADIDSFFTHFPGTICWKSCLLSSVYFSYLLQRSGGCSCVSLFLGPLLLPADLHVCFVSVVLSYNLASGIVMFLALFFLLRIALAIQGHLCFHTNSRIAFFKN